jgi:putative peptidoglycan lipid II flippase
MSLTSGRRAGFLVGAGILLSRIAGLVRQKVFAYYFSTSLAADAFNAAFRIPNFLQNLFGEGVLSASFIPAYAGLLAHDRKEEADRLAGAVGAALALATALIVAAGVLLAPVLVGVIAGGFTGDKRALTVTLVRIFFPGAGLLVLSAWCLGILNSHRKFFISYAVPVVWNLAMIAALIAFGGTTSQVRLAELLAWASVAGSALQFGVQIPFVVSVARNIRLNTAFRTDEARGVLRNFMPAFFGRGIVQISAFIDSYIASWLPTGAVAALSYAQVLYTLPVSLFGMAVSAAELPMMSSARGTADEISTHIRSRIEGGLERIAFFVIPSAVAFLALGDAISAILFESGRFKRSDTVWVWQILAGAAVGLLASTWGRLYSSAFYALRDTRTPVRFAMTRVLFSSAVGSFAALVLPGVLGIDRRYGVAGITIASGMAGWLEYSLLRRALTKRIGGIAVPRTITARCWVAAVISAALAWGYRLTLGQDRGILEAVVTLAIYGVAYIIIATLLKIPEAGHLTARIRRA